MADRKVLNKYYPPDYDPAAIPRLRQAKQRQIQSRIMLPMSVQCTQCGDFVYKGKKFNARKEHVAGDDYLGIKRWRFYFRCPSCLQEITFKTDPQHGGYEVEKGARRNVEPWRDRQKDEEEQRRERERQDEDVMRRLENKSKDGRREHELHEVLEELRERNGRGEKLTLDELVEWHVKRKERQQNDDDERAAKEAFTTRLQQRQRRRGETETNNSSVKGESVVGPKLTIDALDFEVDDSGLDDSPLTEGGNGTGERTDEHEQEADDEDEEEEAVQWTGQRRELMASGLSFGSLIGDEQSSKQATASSGHDRKEGPTSSAATLIVKKRKAEQQPQKSGVSHSGASKKQHENETWAEPTLTTNASTAAKPAVPILSSLLSGYDDDSDSG